MREREQGEEQKKLDVLSNEVFVKALVSSGRTVMHSALTILNIRFSGYLFRILENSQLLID
jgi:hypothetical protein